MKCVSYRSLDREVLVLANWSLEYILSHGPYAGRTIEEVLECDPMWLMQEGYNVTDALVALDEKKQWKDEDDYD